VREDNKKRLRPDYEALDALSALVHFRQYGRNAGRNDGSFPSVYRGQSMEFEDLRPYVPGDNLRDMDWKSSSRAGVAMVRTYVGERRKQILFVGDVGKSMKGTMPDGSSKKECELLTIGTAAYLSGRSGADFSIICGAEWKSRLGHYSRGNAYLEECLNELEDALYGGAEEDFSEKIADILDYPIRGVSICLVTDLKGLVELPEKLLRAMAAGRECYVFEISDANLGDAYHFDVFSDRLIPDFFGRNRGLKAALWERQQELQDEVREKLRRCGAYYAYIEELKEIPETVTKVLNGEITD
jgi:uncharacterized protein (DUF58 family)